VYTNPELFQPSRWIENPMLPLPAFGWGRRICPGIHIARNSLFILIAQLLWTFEFEAVGPKLDPENLIHPLHSGPMPFDAKFVPRKGRDIVVRSEWESAEKDVDVLLQRVKEAQ
jgi:cytochrome P450